MKKIRKSLLLFLVLALSIFLLAGCGDDDSSSSKKKKNDDDSDKTSTSITSKKSALEKVDSEVVGITKKGDCVVKLKNNNNKDVYVNSASVKFYDNSGSVAEEWTSKDVGFCIPANKETYTYVYGSGMDFSKYQKTEVELNSGDPYYEYRTDISVASNNTGKQITITLTNNSDIDLDAASVNIVYYKGGNVVGINSGFTSYGSTLSKNGGKTSFNVSNPYDSNYNDLDFDDFEVYVVSAYSQK